MEVVYAVSITLFVVVVVEHVWRVKWPLRPRPSTILMSFATLLQRFWWQIGRWLAILTDVLTLLRYLRQLLREFWQFLKRLIPFQEIWQTVHDLFYATYQLISAPFWLVKGFLDRWRIVHTTRDMFVVCYTSLVIPALIGILIQVVLHGFTPQLVGATFIVTVFTFTIMM